MRPALLLVLALSSCREPDGKVRALLPPGGAFSEVLLKTKRFKQLTGPTHGYEVSLTAWPNGRELVLLGAVGGEALEKNPAFVALGLRKQALSVEPDGHAVAWTLDGVTWRALHVDGPEPFACLHDVVRPGAIPPTSALARSVLAGVAHPPRPPPTPVRGDAVVRNEQELIGALAYALTSGDPALHEAVAEWMSRPGDAAALQATDVNALFGEQAGVTLRAVFASREDLSGKVTAAARAGNLGEAFVKALTERSSGPATSSNAGVTPCRFASPKTEAPPRPLSLADALAWLQAPDAVSAATCETWRDVRSRIETSARSPPRPQGPRRAPSITAVSPALLPGVIGRPSPPRLDATAVVKDFLRAKGRCGHVDERDLGCEQSAARLASTAWAAAVEVQRRAACPQYASNLDLVRRTVDALDPNGGPDEVSVWVALELVAAGAEPMFCPVPPPDWQRVLVEP